MKMVFGHSFQNAKTRQRNSPQSKKSWMWDLCCLDELLSCVIASAASLPSRCEQSILRRLQPFYKLRQHRTMGAAGFSGSFAPIVQYEKWEIHPVFPHFPYFRLGQNLSPNLLAPLCGDALMVLASRRFVPFSGSRIESGRKRRKFVTGL